MELPDINWEDWWAGLGSFFAMIGVALLVIWIFAPKNVDYYYLTIDSNSNHSGYCVYAHWTWKWDTVAYCTDDKDKALAFTTAANTTVIKPKQ